jgi:hypothetical protein
MSPITRFVRTFAAAELAVVGTLQAALAAGGSGLDMTGFWLGTIAALIAASSAYLLAAAKWVATSPLGKAAVQFLQTLGASLATLKVADLTNAAAVSAGRQFGWMVLAAAGAGLISLLTLTGGSDDVVE